ncbi:hypothetical protein [Streptomyces sp. NPDC096153]|uniref:hypothetical protein n=1 Tax=Streptomyces sp. NPDC096153 TaxID=3155548 RepID=UPI0033166AFA
MPTTTLRSPRLFLLRLTVTDEQAGQSGSWAMPAAPFGSAPWQLPTLAAYLRRLHRSEAPPGLDEFAAYLAGRAQGPVPVPQAPYVYDPLHDPRIVCWIDVHAEPARDGERWPRCSVVVMEQESGLCRWSRITRLRTAHHVIAYTHTEATAEAQRLADRMRRCPHEGTAAALELAEQVRDWAQGAHRQVKAEQTLVQAGRVRRALREGVRTVAVSAPGNTPQSA